MAPACIVCDGRLVPNAVNARSAEISEPVAFYACERCGAMVAPEATRVAEKLYQDRSSTNFAPGKSALLRKLKAWLMRRTYSPLIRREGIEAIIDYGCGNGDLANVMIDIVPKVYAIDMPETRPIDLDLQIDYASIDQPLPLFEGRRAAYILRHVVEHFADPRAVMALLAAALKPGDLLVIETPVVHSAFRALMGDYWPGYFPPYHTFVPSERSLRLLAEGAGLKVIQISKREPAIVGSYLHQKRGNVGNVSRWLAAGALPAQWLTSKLTGRSEAIEIVIRK